MAISYDISISIYSYWREHLGYNSRSYRRYFSLPTKISYISRFNNLMPFSNHHNTQITTLYIIEYNPKRMYMYVQGRNSGLQSLGVPRSPMESRGVPKFAVSPLCMCHTSYICLLWNLTFRDKLLRLIYSLM
jgi:hypothetical protein